MEAYRRSNNLLENPNWLAQPKENIGVLEATGTMIVDDAGTYSAMYDWNDPRGITEQFKLMLRAICPEARLIEEFEGKVATLFS